MFRRAFAFEVNRHRVGADIMLRRLAEPLRARNRHSQSQTVFEFQDGRAVPDPPSAIQTVVRFENEAGAEEPDGEW